MEQKSMTALVSAFSRAYHSENNEVKIFDDRIAKSILTGDEYNQISSNMMQGVRFFNSSFVGTEKEALRWVVDNQLSPTPLGRAAYTERALETVVRTGVRQYLIFAAGYDTFAYRQPGWARDLQIFELDHPATARDKQARLEKAAIEIPGNVHYAETDFTDEAWQNTLLRMPDFDAGKMSFCSLLGISYYLSEQAFARMMDVTGSIVPKGSRIVFDYPDEKTYTDQAGGRAKKQVAMAGAAGEKMLANYSYDALEKILNGAGFFICECLTPEEITRQYFKSYNIANPEHEITAFDNVNYCLAIRK